jgi:nucleotide-binding universal stress UspA family protein
MIRAIAHPTDFSPDAQIAFEHALALAAVYRCRLDLIHVHSPGAEDHWESFPHVRETLHRWGRLEAHATPEDIKQATGIDVHKIEVEDPTLVDGLARFLSTHGADLVVTASHGRGGLDRWLAGSVSRDIARITHFPTLIFGPHAQPFIDSKTGAVLPLSILAPVCAAPAPDRALDRLKSLTETLHAELALVHVGAAMPATIDVHGLQYDVRRLEGPVEASILSEASACEAKIIAMPTARRHGIIDALLGSTTEHIVRRAPCPVLALPA